MRIAIQAVAVLATVTLLRSEVVEPVRVSSDSMAATFDRGDVILLDKLATRAGSPARGEIVSFQSPQDHLLTLKRVVGVSGDRVEIRDAYLFVNGRRVEEPFVDHASEDATYFGPVTVPRRSLFLMGDNRANSIDSRNYGVVPLAAVSGRVRCRLWPWR